MNKTCGIALSLFTLACVVVAILFACGVFAVGEKDKQATAEEPEKSRVEL